jgi:glycosyltransferase involved in cell wall biosynthesis
VFAGFRPDVPALLCAADVLVLPSVFPEGSPVAVLEAMAMEVPVVATSVGGVPELVRDGETGLLVPPGDVAALAAAVVRLLSDRAGAVAMARRARQRVLERHTVTSMVDRLERSFTRVLEDA